MVYFFIAKIVCYAVKTVSGQKLGQYESNTLVVGTKLKIRLPRNVFLTHRTPCTRTPPAGYIPVPPADTRAKTHYDENIFLFREHAAAARVYAHIRMIN